MNSKENKKLSFKEALFESVSWRPQTWEVIADESANKSSDKRVEAKTQNETQEIKDSRDISKEEALISMKEFTSKMLGEDESAKVVLNDVEIKRQRDLAEYKLSGVDLLSDLGELWSDFSSRLEMIKKSHSVKVVFVVSDFKLQNMEDRFHLCLEVEESKLLKKMIEAMKLSLDEVWITACSASSDIFSKDESDRIIHSEILYFNPKVIITLGAIATHYFMQKNTRLSLVQSEYFSYSIEYKDKITDYSYMPMFHPEYLLINPNMKRKSWEGMQKLMERL